MTHFKSDEIRAAINDSPVSELVLTLTQRDHAWNPASTSRDIFGPAKVTYRQFRDGGYEAIVEDLDATP